MNYYHHEILWLFLQGVGTSIVPSRIWYQVLLFRLAKASDKVELKSPVYTLSWRIGRYLDCQGLLVRSMVNTYPSLETLNDHPP